MRKLLLSVFALTTALSGFSQITITQADLGQAGDSIVVGNDNTPPAGLSVGNASSSSQTWDFTSLSVSNINTLKFEFPANTASGSLFPNADLATERQQDTIFYNVTATEFSIDGITGDPFNIGVTLALNFDPDIKQLDFPSTLNSAFTTTAYIDSTVSCDINPQLQSFNCDSARIKRVITVNSNIDAFGDIETPGGNYTTIRQYLHETSFDTAWVLLPFLGWTQALQQDSTAYYYRWYANGEDWPVLSVTADAPNGNITTAEFKVDDNLISYITTMNHPNCNGDCDGYAMISGLGGVPPYNYQWPTSAGGGTSNSANNLCAGTYDVTVYDANNDSTIQTVEIIDPELFSVSAAIQPENAGNDGAIDITASGGTGSYTYSWSGPNGFSATTEDLDGLTVGTYTLHLTDGHGCDSTFSYLMFATGVESIDNDLFALYPNPAQTEVNLVAKSTINDYVLRDLLGNLVKTELNIGQSNKTLDVSELKAGLYIIEINTTDGSYLKKLTIQ